MSEQERYQLCSTYDGAILYENGKEVSNDDDEISATLNAQAAEIARLRKRLERGRGCWRRLAQT